MHCQSAVEKGVIGLFPLAELFWMSVNIQSHFLSEVSKTRANLIAFAQTDGDAPQGMAPALVLLPQDNGSSSKRS